jgi:hypothetical protein
MDALMFAVESHASNEMVELLIAKGADVKATSRPLIEYRNAETRVAKEGMNATTYAEKCGASDEVVKILATGRKRSYCTLIFALVKAREICLRNNCIPFLAVSFQRVILMTAHAGDLAAILKALKCCPTYSVRAFASICAQGVITAHLPITDTSKVPSILNFEDLGLASQKFTLLLQALKVRAYHCL